MLPVETKPVEQITYPGCEGVNSAKSLNLESFLAIFLEHLHTEKWDQHALILVLGSVTSSWRTDLYFSSSRHCLLSRTDQHMAEWCESPRCEHQPWLLSCSHNHTDTQWVRCRPLNLPLTAGALSWPVWKSFITASTECVHWRCAGGDLAVWAECLMEGCCTQLHALTYETNMLTDSTLGVNRDQLWCFLA